jgi:hypothetical protein
LSRRQWRTEVRRYEGNVRSNGNCCPVPKNGTARYHVNTLARMHFSATCNATIHEDSPDYGAAEAVA